MAAKQDDDGLRASYNIYLLIAQTDKHTGYDLTFIGFQKHYNKRYHDEEDDIRRKNWEDAKRRIKEFNKEYNEGKHSFEMRINSLSDWHDEEIEKHNCLHPHPHDHKVKKFEKRFRCDKRCQRQLPKEVDWRKKKEITPVRHQYHCGSCYAFGVAAVLEAYNTRLTGKMVTLSVQEIVDCSIPLGNNGCSGGTPALALQFVLENHGLVSEKAYPYWAKTMKCHKKDLARAKRYAALNTYYQLKEKDEIYLKAVVALFGPVTASIRVAKTAHHYGKGFLTHKDCHSYGGHLNHVVAIVGYGVKDNTPYWLIKNSWGPDWGYHGYAYIVRDGTNHCGIASKNLIPELRAR
ncbi:cathepsin L2-like [Parasteatoda tepidariorum]|uniref:cathepsin L2-like n=1 Tax=Parasteatoda tepidariorum TaxID=114398 RepID=UPI0039BD5BF3